jgi:hypothetical protein
VAVDNLDVFRDELSLEFTSPNDHSLFEGAFESNFDVFNTDPDPLIASDARLSFVEGIDLNVDSSFVDHNDDSSDLFQNGIDSDTAMPIFETNRQDLNPLFPTLDGIDFNAETPIVENSGEGSGSLFTTLDGIDWNSDSLETSNNWISEILPALNNEEASLLIADSSACDATANADDIQLFGKIRRRNACIASPEGQAKPGGGGGGSEKQPDGGTPGDKQPSIPYPDLLSRWDYLMNALYSEDPELCPEPNFGTSQVPVCHQNGARREAAIPPSSPSSFFLFYVRPGHSCRPGWSPWCCEEIGVIPRGAEPSLFGFLLSKIPLPGFLYTSLNWDNVVSANGCYRKLA